MVKELHLCAKFRKFRDNGINMSIERQVHGHSKALKLQTEYEPLSSVKCEMSARQKLKFLDLNLVLKKFLVYAEIEDCGTSRAACCDSIQVQDSEWN